MTPEALLLEAQYYNIEPLEREIMEKKPSSTRVKYEACIIKPYRFPNIDKSWNSGDVEMTYLPLSKEGAESYLVDRALSGLDLGNSYLHDTITGLMRRRNDGNTSNEYKWTIMAISTNNKRIDHAEGVVVVLKGETMMITKTEKLSS